jgi:hypothetical protein
LYSQQFLSGHIHFTVVELESVPFGVLLEQAYSLKRKSLQCGVFGSNVPSEKNAISIVLWL